MEHRYDKRAEELTNLRLALATLALQLDAFEARLKGRRTKMDAELTKLVSPDVGFARRVIGAMKNRPLADRKGDFGVVLDHGGIAASSGVRSVAVAARTPSVCLATLERTTGPRLATSFRGSRINLRRRHQA